jgi:outer membrane lipoprotein carrier protein
MLNFKKMSLAVVIVLNCFLVTPLYADSAGDDLTKLLLDIHTMQAGFSQVIQDKSAKSLQQSQGQMSLSRPGKFRWDIQKPVAQLIIANGTRLWIYDADLEQVTIRAFHRAAGQTPALLLSDRDLALSKDFTVQMLPNPSQIAGSQLFLLTAKNKDDPFEKIRLAFLNKQIHEMRLEDRLGHVTTITFHNVKTGVTLPDSLFTFKPTANIDVIDETKNRK